MLLLLAIHCHDHWSNHDFCRKPLRTSGRIPSQIVTKCWWKHPTLPRLNIPTTLWMRLPKVNEGLGPHRCGARWSQRNFSDFPTSHMILILSYTYTYLYHITVIWHVFSPNSASSIFDRLQGFTGFGVSEQIILHHSSYVPWLYAFIVTHPMSWENPNIMGISMVYIIYGNPNIME